MAGIKIVVIGAGNVGQAVAYTLMVRRQANEIVFIDKDNERAKSAAKDIAHGTGFFSQVWIREGDYKDCADARLVIITAGVGRKPGQSRLELAEVNVDIARGITKDIMKYADNPIILVVSNPADIITAAVLEGSGLPRGRVIGSGTSLDTARFRYLISEALRTDVAEVNAYVLGEHGDSQVAVWSDVTIAGIPLSLYEDQLGIHIDRKSIEEHTRKGGAEIIAGKGATFYGVAMAVSNIAENILQIQGGVVPVAHKMDTRFGAWAGVVLSMPCLLNKDGVLRTLNIPLNEDEKEKMYASARVLKEMQIQLGLWEA